MGELRSLPVSEIRENPVALRTVNRQGEDYLGLVNSIMSKGFLGAITVRPREDSESGESYFELVDGLHRFSASKDAGLTEINVDIVSLSDDQVMEAQIMANIHKVETRPVEYSKQLLRILARNPLMSEAELATQLGKSSSWIGQRLGLNKIDNENIQQLVNEGKIKLANAYAMAKLPPEEMADFVDRAMTQPPDEFVPVVNDRVKEIRDSKRKGKDAKPQVFQPVAFMQKMKDIKVEMESPDIGGTLCNGLRTPLDGFTMAVRWMLHLDPQSIAIQKAKDDERKDARAAATKKRKDEREAKKKEADAVKDADAANAVASANEALS